MTLAPVEHEKKKKHHARHKIHVAHHTHGRVRMKVPTAKGNPEEMARIAETFVGTPGVRKVEANPVTGSLVVHYAAERRAEIRASILNSHGTDFEPPETEIDKLTGNIEREAKFLAEHSHTAAVIVDFFAKLDAGIKRNTDNYVDLKIVLAAAIVAGTMMEVGMAAATPVWLTLCVFSVNHMVQLHQHQLMRESAQSAVPA
jgi:hypothetical protein